MSLDMDMDMAMDMALQFGYLQGDLGAGAWVLIRY